MPDPLLFLKAVAVAALAAAAALLFSAWPWRTPRPGRLRLGRVLGVALGFFAGCWMLGVEPHWPPREDLDRLLLVLFPVAVLVELVPLLPRVPCWLVRVLHWAVVVGAAPLLLYNTSYLAALEGPGSREWTPLEACFILTGLAATFETVWLLLAQLAKCRGSRTLLLALAFACGATAMTVMMTGYASGGQVGLPLAAALLGLTAASLLLKGPFPINGSLGLGVLGLFSLVVAGRFFGALPTTYALVLFLSPLLAWLPEFLPALRKRPRLLAAGKLALAVIPVAAVLALVVQGFLQKSPVGPGGNGASMPQPSLEDYLNFGK